MPRFEETVRIDADARAVWDVLSDLGRADEWIPGVESSEVVTGGPVREGSHVREVRRVKGKVLEADFHVTRFDPPRRLGLDVRLKGVDGHGGFTIRDAGGAASRVTYDVEFDDSEVGFLARRVIGHVLKDQMTTDLHALKRRVEHGT